MNATDEDGDTALTFAVKRASTDAVQVELHLQKWY